MAMYFYQMAAPLLCQPGTIFLHLSTNAPTSDRGIHSKIADAGKISFKGDLGDEMEGHKGFNLTFIFVYEQAFIRVADHLPEPVFHEPLRIGILQLMEQFRDGFAIGDGGLSYAHIIYLPASFYGIVTYRWLRADLLFRR